MIFSMHDFVSQLSEIYPLTIVKTIHGNFAIVQAESDYDSVASLQGDEEFQYQPHLLMAKEYPDTKFGFGKTIYEALVDYESRNN